MIVKELDNNPFMNVQVRAFDPAVDTAEEVPSSNPNLEFYRKGVSNETDEEYDTLHNHIKR